MSNKERNDKDVNNIKEDVNLKMKFLQQPISFLTEENLNMKESIEILKEHYIKHKYYDDETLSIATQELLNYVENDIATQQEQMLKAINTVNKEKENWIKAYQEEKDKQFDLIKRIQELEEENRKLKAVRVKYDYGYENTHFYTKNDLAKIDKNRYVIEVKGGEFVDVKQLYIDALNSILKQKVKDVLQNNRNELFCITYVSEKQYRPYEMQIERINKIEQELLEGEK